MATTQPQPPQPQAPGRPVAAGGWRRAVIGLLVGGVAGALATTALPAGTSTAAHARAGRRCRGRGIR